MKFRTFSNKLRTMRDLIKTVFSSKRFECVEESYVSSLKRKLNEQRCSEMASTTMMSEHPTSQAEEPILTIQGKRIDADFDVRLDYFPCDLSDAPALPKPEGLDAFARSRDAIADPINSLIRKVETAGGVNKDGSVILHNGLQVPLIGSYSYYGEFSHLLVLNRGVHEPLEEFLFQEVVNSLNCDPVMIELGAYWAHYSMWIKSKFPNADVTMVEPDRVNLRAGQKNFIRNNLEGKFIQDFVGNGHFGIDSYLQRSGIDRIDILHADIQGFELEMIDGATCALKKGKIDRIFISTHSDELHNHCVEKLSQFGYKIVVSSSFQESTSWDGIIFAARTPDLSPIESFTPASRREIYEMTYSDTFKYLNMVLSKKKGK